MSVKSIRPGFSAVIALLLTSVACHGTPKPQRNGPAAGGPAGPVATVAVQRAEEGPVEESLATFGTVEFDPHQERTVSFVSAGQIAQVLVTPGQAITRGDPLLKLGPLPASSLEVQQARINLDYAERNLERLRRLLQRHLATNEAVQQAEKDVASARAALEGLGVDGTGGPRVIAAPFSGVVVEVPVTSGNIVHPGEEAMLVAPEHGLVVRAGFEPEDALGLEAGMPVRIEPVFAAGGEHPARGVLARLHRVVDPATQLVEALVRPVELPGWMAAGTRVRLEVVVRSASHAVRVPRDALVSRDGEIGVFAVESGAARWHRVQVGIESDRWAEIRGGLDVGALVVTTGRTSLQDGMAVVAAETPGA